jgi:hypothetical protein
MANTPARWFTVGMGRRLRRGEAGRAIDDRIDCLTSRLLAPIIDMRKCKMTKS